MSINGSNKEGILSLYLKKNKSVLQEILDDEITNIELERTNGRNKIDVYGIIPKRKLEVFVEIQVTPSDPKHMNSIINKIQSIAEGVVIWISACFKSKHIESVLSILNIKAKVRRSLCR